MKDVSILEKHTRQFISSNKKCEISIHFHLNFCELKFNFFAWYFCIFRVKTADDNLIANGLLRVRLTRIVVEE